MIFATTTTIPFAPVTAGPADVAWVPAISLDCAQALVRIPGMGQWMPPADYTIECWVFALPGEGQGAFNMENDEGGQNRIMAHLPWQSDGQLYFDSGNLNTTGRLHQAMPPDFLHQWHHMAFQVDSTAPAMRMFIDGQLFAQSTAIDPYKPRNIDFLIGWLHRGLLGEFRIWNQVRTPAQIQATMHRVFTSSRPGLIGCWRLDDTLTPGGSIQDYSGYERHGVLNRR